MLKRNNHGIKTNGSRFVRLFYNEDGSPVRRVKPKKTCPQERTPEEPAGEKAVRERLQPSVAVIKMLQGEILECSAADVDDIICVWWSDKCATFHWSLNGRFKGIWVHGSFANLVSTNTRQYLAPRQERF